MTYGLLVASVAVILILIIFIISGHQQLLDQLLNNTARGGLFGIAFTAGGPFGMWIIATAFIFVIWSKHGYQLNNDECKNLFEYCKLQ